MLGSAEVCVVDDVASCRNPAVTLAGVPRALRLDTANGKAWAPTAFFFNWPKLRTLVSGLVPEGPACLNRFGFFANPGKLRAHLPTRRSVYKGQRLTSQNPPPLIAAYGSRSSG